MQWSIGALLFPVVVHIACLLLSASVGTSESCPGIADIWCGSPFEGIAETFSTERNYNFFTIGLGLMGGTLQLILGLILLDYDVLKAQEYSVWAAVGDGIRIISGVILLGVTITGAMAIFRR